MNSLALVFDLTKPAAAYIDPATTSYLIQIVVGVVIAVGTFIGVYRNKIKRFFKKKTDNADNDIKDVKMKDNNEKEVITAADLLDDNK